MDCINNNTAQHACFSTANIWPEVGKIPMYPQKKKQFYLTATFKAAKYIAVKIIG